MHSAGNGLPALAYTPTPSLTLRRRLRIFFGSGPSGDFPALEGNALRLDIVNGDPE